MKTMRKLLQQTFLTVLTIIFAVLTTFSQTATQPAGSGTEQDPYQIETLENLYWLAITNSVWDKHFIQVADIDATPTSGWDNDSGFTPIALGPGFDGTYNGKGHSIDGLYINRPNHNYLALFMYNNNGSKIDSLSLTNINISGADVYGGGISSVSNGTINHCSASGSISGNEFIGGLVGENLGTIKNSYSSCTVTSQNSPSYIGGLIGYNRDSVLNCYSTGDISGVDYIGGLVGYNDWKIPIINSYSRSNVTGDSVVGGLAGWNVSGFITNCYSTGTVTGNQKIGGLVAKLYPPTTTTHSYWDKETSGIDTSVEGTGRSTAEMLNDTTYLNNTWDFVCEDANGTANVWAMLDGMNDGYPILAWQYEGPVPTQEPLQEVTGQGSVTVSETPTAQNICGDPINGTTDDPLTYESEGTYTITWTYEDSQGNTTTQEQTVTVSAPDGINELEKAGINLYPNPVGDKINIRSTSEQVSRVVVTDLSGRVCLQKTTNNQNEVLNLSKLNSGIYLIQLETEKGKYTTKIVKK